MKKNDESTSLNSILLSVSVLSISNSFENDRALSVDNDERKNVRIIPSINTSLSMSTTKDEQKEKINEIPAKDGAKKIMKGFCLAISYSASIGGAGSLVGTQPNLILKGYFEKNYPNDGLNFLTYMAYALPTAIIMLTLSWLAINFLWLINR